MVLVSHGGLAREMRAAMEHVVGPQRGIATICIGIDDDVETRRADILAAIEEVDTGDGVIVLTDMFGGTPSNLAMSLLGRPQTEILTGVNLPMLVKLAKCRSSQTLPESVACAEAAGKKYIGIASVIASTGGTMNTCGSVVTPPKAA
jgi:PTS system mannose-specific IIA component